MSEGDFVLERTQRIAAARQTVFEFFENSELFARWWGAGSSIDARPGGRLRIVYPNGVIASGNVLEIAPPQRIRFSYGYEAPGTRPAAGTSIVEISLSEDSEGTLLRLRHFFDDADLRDAHGQGWSYQLAVFARESSAFAHSDFERRIDQYFAAWSATEAEERRRLLEEAAEAQLQYHDAYAATSSCAALVEHINAARAHLGKNRLERSGPATFMQGSALCRWQALNAAGDAMFSGTNYFRFAASGRIAAVIGFAGF
ncbi:MAG: SRPBCC domain-containing protein [Leptospirales bacterium]|nr:SRPBCC domain-containing protein [Leptospirales bacterium]